MIRLDRRGLSIRRTRLGADAADLVAHLLPQDRVGDAMTLGALDVGVVDVPPGSPERADELVRLVLDVLAKAVRRELVDDFRRPQLGRRDALRRRFR